MGRRSARLFALRCLATTVGTMALTTLSQRRAFRSLSLLLHRGLVTEGDVDEFGVLYSRVWNGHGISVGQGCGFGAWARTTDVPAEWMATHHRLRHQDPSEQILANSPDGTPFITSFIWDAAAKRTEIYREFVGYGYRDSMVQRFSSPHLGDVFSVVHRVRGARRFDHDDVTLARAIHSLVGGALATRSALHALGISGAARPSFHAFVSFPRLTVRMDERALLGWRRVLGQPLGPRGVRRVERLVERIALDFFHGKVGARSRHVLPSLRAETAWVPPRRDESMCALVMFFAEQGHGGLVLTAPATELLSPTQRRVAELAANGLNNVAIATAMTISVETVRSHLKEAMRRLGVARKTELVAFTERPAQALR